MVVGRGSRVLFENNTVQSAQLNERLHAYVCHVGVVASQLVAFEQDGDQAGVEKERLELGRRLEERHTSRALPTCSAVSGSVCRLAKIADQILKDIFKN